MSKDRGRQERVAEEAILTIQQKGFERGRHPPMSYNYKELSRHGWCKPIQGGMSTMSERLNLPPLVLVIEDDHLASLFYARVSGKSWSTGDLR
jgi:hypothetical protein